MDPITHRERTRPTRDSIKASLNRLHVFFEDVMPEPFGPILEDVGPAG
jgi:hypothetical protein